MNASPAPTKRLDNPPFPVSFLQPRRVGVGAWRTPMTKKTIYRSSETGRIVKKDYAENHPRTTEKERVNVPPPKPDPKKK
jgi:hypothetical protein